MRVVIAGGGTGGHLFPGIALAEEIMTRAPNQHDVLFIGTERGLEAKVVPQQGYKLELIEVSGLKRVGLWRFLRSLFALPAALVRCIQILRRYKPHVVVGVGGYASGPVVLAGWLLRLPTAIQEQNALPGVTNRILGRIVDHVFTAFPEAMRQFPEHKVLQLGNPIRRQLLDNYLLDPVPHDKFHLLVFGGSQGAHILNQTMIEAIPYLASVREKIRIVHQTGERELALVRHGYAQAGADAEVVDFIKDMSAAYAEADAIVCRAGATTLAELTVAKKPAVLVPYAAAADNHQELNARSLVQAGAAVMLLERELTGERLAKEIFALMNPERRRQMEKAAAHLGRPEAAKEISDFLVETTRKRWGKNWRAA
jgi:UDP-N-acetylglucosamine--N-acetylmuramyl-(pentapeptide) pyrophosphoryl-undecaprenol N-acetylglucosamine transferase